MSTLFCGATREPMIQRKDIESIKQAGADFWNNNPCGGEWEAYPTFYDWMMRTEPYFFEILSHYNVESALVCDVGCGQGAKSVFLAQRGAKVYGLEPV